MANNSTCNTSGCNVCKSKTNADLPLDLHVCDLPLAACKDMVGEARKYHCSLPQRPNAAKVMNPLHRRSCIATLSADSLSLAQWRQGGRETQTRQSQAAPFAQPDGLHIAIADLCLPKTSDLIEHKSFPNHHTRAPWSHETIRHP